MEELNNKIDIELKNNLINYIHKLDSDINRMTSLINNKREKLKEKLDDLIEIENFEMCSKIKHVIDNCDEILKESENEKRNK